MNPEKVLQFVAEIIDAKFAVCDDGYVIELQSPFMQDGLKDSSKHVCIQFNQDGDFDKTIIH
jgi:hypothetical protein